MDCHYCWNQPKKFGQYDFYLDGKIKADEYVYRKKNTETGKIESFSVTDEIDTINERLKTHFAFETTYKTYADLESAFKNGELKETVIYVVENENSSDNPDSKDKYNEYMIISVTNDDGSISKSLELIGSGSYAKQTTDLYQVTGYTNFNSFDAQKQDGKDINSRINKEISRATSRENAIQEIYDSITGYDFVKITDSSKSIKSIIEKEIIDRTNDVNDEENRAKKAEEEINTKIDNTSSALNAKIDTITGYELTESDTLKEGDKNIDERIKDEISRATAKETLIDGDIKKIQEDISKAQEDISKNQEDISKAQENISKAQEDIINETQRITEVENELIERFDEEKNNRETTDNVLDERITNLEGLIIDNAMTLINELRIKVADLESRIMILEAASEPDSGEVIEPEEEVTEPVTPEE